MARVTVEDCVGEEKTNNRFELVILSAQRTKEIQSGTPITLPEDRDKATVISLREIAAGNIKIPELRKKFLDSLNPNYSMMNEESEELNEIDGISEEVYDFIDSVDDFGLSEDEMIIDDENFSTESEDLDSEIDKI